MTRRKSSVPMRGAIFLLFLCVLMAGGAYWNKRHINWPFISAAGDGDIQKVRAELDAGVRPDDPHWQGATAMQFAAYSGRDEVVKLLLARGADPNGGMHQAKMMGHDSIVHLLRQAGAKE